MNTALVVDYGLCNIDSICRAIEVSGGRALVADDPAAVARASHVVLPGVGAFAEAMRILRDRGWVEALTDDVLKNGIPLLGICLGMQLLSTSGEEGHATAGLGFIPGRTVPLESTENERIPHMGWNEVQQLGACPLFSGIPDGKDFYFVHSYQFVAEDRSDVRAETPYCGGFTSAIGRDRVFGVQFHPEKSLRVGAKLLGNFMSVC